MSAAQKFAEMTDKQFEDYLYNNPGGAAKAYRLRCEGSPKGGGSQARVEYRDRVVEKQVKFIPKWMKVVTGISAILTLGSLSSVRLPEVVTKMKEVPVEVVKEVEVPVEVVREVNVPGPVQYVDREVTIVDTRREERLEKVIHRQDEIIEELRSAMRRSGIKGDRLPSTVKREAASLVRSVL